MESSNTRCVWLAPCAAPRAAAAPTFIAEAVPDSPAAPIRSVTVAARVAARLVPAANAPIRCPNPRLVWVRAAAPGCLDDVAAAAVGCPPPTLDCPLPAGEALPPEAVGALRLPPLATLLARELPVEPLGVVSRAGAAPLPPDEPALGARPVELTGAPAALGAGDPPAALAPAAPLAAEAASAEEPPLANIAPAPSAPATPAPAA